MSARRRALAAAAALAASFACFAAASAWWEPGLRPEGGGGELSPADREAVLEALVSFQRIYQDFFASGGDPALLDDFPASREVKHQIFRDIGFVRDAGLLFVQDLAAATLVRTVRKGDGLAEAVTYEEWNHVFQRTGDRVPASALRGTGQGFRYGLRREGPRWIVTGWELEELPPPPGEGGRKW